MNRTAWGVGLIGLGTLALLQSLNLFNFGLAVWPVTLTLLGFAILWGSFRSTSWFGLALGLWLSGIGLMDILRNAGVTALSGNDVATKGWPLLLIAIGISVVLNRQGGKRGEPRVRVEWDGVPFRIGDVEYGAQGNWRLDGDLDLNRTIGDVNLDLSAAEILPGEHRITVRGGIGDVFIRVPDNISLDVWAQCGIGDVELLGEHRDGFSQALQRQMTVPDSPVTVTIQARQNIGSVRIVQVRSTHRCDL